MIISNIDVTNLDQVKSRLGSLKDKAPIAMYRAINDSVAKTKTETKRAISKRYHIKQKDVKDNIYPFKASKSKLKGAIVTRGEKISLYNFKTKEGKLISAAVLRENSPKSLEHNPKAFIATMKNKGKDGSSSEHMGIFERKIPGEQHVKKRKKMKKGKERAVTKHNVQIRELKGPAVPQMMGNVETMEVIKAAANETLRKRLEHYINYFLENG